MFGGGGGSVHKIQGASGFGFMGLEAWRSGFRAGFRNFQVKGLEAQDLGCERLRLWVEGFGFRAPGLNEA